MKVCVFYNSKASSGNGKAVVGEVEKFFPGKTAEYHDVIENPDYSGIFSSLEKGDDVVLCGGDGTLMRFANDVYDLKFDRDIYYYPAGTGNDFYTDVFGKDEKKPVVINDYIKNLPTVTVNGKSCRFVNGIGYGIDGYCCEVGDKLREKSDKPVNYTSIAIKGLLFHYKPTNAVVTVDGKEYKFKKVWLAPTMNGRMYGGGMIPTPDQQRLSDDKKVSVMVMNGVGKLRTLIAFPTIFEGKHVDKPIVHIFKGKKVKVEFDRPTALQIDGETVLGVSSYEVVC